MKKAQISMEFLMMIIAGILFVSVLISLALHISKTTISHRQFEELDNLASSIASEIILASQTHVGYKRTFYIPQSLKSTSYTITSTSNSVTLSLDSKQITKEIPAISGSLTKGKNVIKHENNTLLISH